MAIVECMKEYEMAILTKAGLAYKGLNWGELGNQTYNGKPSKELYNALGTKHTSIDLINLIFPEQTGLLAFDLSQPIPHRLEFDVLTNYGTSEHVVNQYECFCNVHNMVKKGGLIIHGVPLTGNWPNHCRYYFNETFFRELAALCKYNIIDIKTWNTGFYKYPKNLVSAVFVKSEDAPFISKEAFNNIKGIFDSKDNSKTQSYAMKLKTGMRSKDNALLKLIGDLPSNIVMAEVGCYAGESTLMFLKSGKVKKLFAIDPWMDELGGVIEGTTEEIERTKYVYTNMRWAEDSFDVRIIPFTDKVVKLRMTLNEALPVLPELDFIYIDGDHRYQAVLKDIQLAKKIVRKGGIIAGHDYVDATPGVKRAVNESFNKLDKLYTDSSWMKKLI